jgi:DNA primase
VQRLALAQPLLQLRGVTAALERQKCLKRCRHLLDAWSGQRLETLERCIARLLQGDGPGLEPVGLDMEGRIDALFSQLNADALRFQALYYNERKHLEHLDFQRRAAYGEVLAQPAA